MASSSPYVLQASVEAHSVRTLRAMLQCLDRFGKELFLECNDTEVRAAPEWRGSTASHACCARSLYSARSGSRALAFR